MSNLSINAYNYSTNNWSLCTYVGGISAVAGTAVATIPLAWSVAGFPKVQSTGAPGKTIVSWTVNYGFSIVNSGTSGQTNWSASSQVDNQALGTQIPVTYDPLTQVYNLGTPSPGPAGILRFLLDKSIPPNPSPVVSIGVNINGVPAAALPSNYFQPNLMVDFSVNPTYSVCCAVNFLLGDIITGSVASTAHQVVFVGGATSRDVSYSPTNTWSDGKTPAFSSALSGDSSNPVARLLTHDDGTYEVFFYTPSSTSGGSTGGTDTTTPPPRSNDPVPFLFSDDLTSAVAISKDQAKFLRENVPSALVIEPSGPAVNVAIGSQLQNIPNTAGDNRGSPWIGFWERNTDLNRNTGCVINTALCTAGSYQGSHVYLGGQGQQWYITNECAYHNNPARAGVQTLARASKAVPITTWVAQLLTEVFKARASSPENATVKVSDLFTIHELQALRQGKKL